MFDRVLDEFRVRHDMQLFHVSCLMKPGGAMGNVKQIGYFLQRSPLCKHLQNFYGAWLTPGIVHVPSNSDGGVSRGQYILSISWNLSEGAGSQLLSLSLPGLSCCR